MAVSDAVVMLLVRIRLFEIYLKDGVEEGLKTIAQSELDFMNKVLNALKDES